MFALPFCIVFNHLFETFGALGLTLERLFGLQREKGCQKGLQIINARHPFSRSFSLTLVPFTLVRPTSPLGKARAAVCAPPLRIDYSLVRPTSPTGKGSAAMCAPHSHRPPSHLFKVRSGMRGAARGDTALAVTNSTRGSSSYACVSYERNS